MKFNYQFSNLCGVSYKSGNVIFTPDGGSLLSPVGNRVTLFDLESHRAETLPFESRKNIQRIALSHDARLLVVVDTDGRGLMINFARRAILHRFNLKKRVRALQFSPDSRFLAASNGNHIQVWNSPDLQVEFSPLALHRTYTGHHEEIVSVSWSPAGRYFVSTSKDHTARIYSTNPEEGYEPITLSGHRENMVAAFFRVEAADALEVDMMEDEAKGQVPGAPAATASLVEQPRSRYCINTVSKDGAVISWNWRWVPGAREAYFRNLNNNNKNTATDLDTLRQLDPIELERQDAPLSVRLGAWVQEQRHFMQRDSAKITCASLPPGNAANPLLLLGFNNGVFGLYDMTTAAPLHTLSVSQHALNTCAVNASGDWVALASADLGQLLVWEWQSETYVLKQQGHFYDLSTVAYSPDGQLIATGGDDHKLKLWSTSSGFCFTTFTQHEGPVTGVAFLGDGNAVLSCSLDGTVRAFDLVRYRNFRTLTTPDPVQFTCLAVDGAGEVVCAGALDPAQIYLWSLQTGRLLDVLSGHEGPISSLVFSPTGPTMASASWDNTVKMWEPYKSTACTETLSHNAQVLSLAFRPDGKQLCSATLDGLLNFWVVESAKACPTIDGRRDISGGRRRHDRVTAANSAHSKYFTSVCYTADGLCVLAGGHSKYVCIYEIEHRMLLKKFQLSHNRSMDGILDELHSGEMTEAGPRDNIAMSGSDSEGDADAPDASAGLPGAARDDKGKRRVAAEIRSKSVRFSPTGHAWAAATTQGLMVYSLDDAMLFDPVNVDQDVTPTTIRAAVRKEQYAKALIMSLHLGEVVLIRQVYQTVPMDQIKLVARNVPVLYLSKLLETIASEIGESSHLEYQLTWSAAILTSHNDTLRDMSAKFLKSFRAIQRAVAKHNKDLGALCDDNLYTLTFVTSASVPEGGIGEMVGDEVVEE